MRKVRSTLFFLTGYLIFRFLCDFLKPYEIIFGLRGIQWACILGLICSKAFGLARSASGDAIESQAHDD